MQMVQSFFVWVTLHSQKQTTDQLRRVYTEHLNLWQHIIPCSELISHHFMGITIIHGFITRMWTKICSCGTFVKANYKLWFLRSIHQRPIYTRRFVSPIRQGPIYTRGFVGTIRQKLFHTRGFVGPIHQRPIYTRGFVGPIRRKLIYTRGFVDPFVGGRFICGISQPDFTAQWYHKDENWPELAKICCTPTDSAEMGPILTCAFIWLSSRPIIIACKWAFKRPHYLQI